MVGPVVVIARVAVGEAAGVLAGEAAAGVLGGDFLVWACAGAAKERVAIRAAARGKLLIG
jgi:hypothetical protein